MDVRGSIGHALYLAQSGGEAVSVKALKGFSGRDVLEIIEDFYGDTFRAVYTVRFAEAVYVLHAFQEKIEARHRHAPARDGSYSAPFEVRGKRLPAKIWERSR